MNQLPGPILRAITAFSSESPQMSTADARESGNQEMGPKLEPLSTLVLMPTSRGPAPGSSQVMATFWFEKSASCSADRKSTRLNSSHGYISYAVFCLKKKKRIT